MSLPKPRWVLTPLVGLTCLLAWSATAQGGTTVQKYLVTGASIGTPNWAYGIVGPTTVSGCSDGPPGVANSLAWAQEIALDLDALTNYSASYAGSHPSGGHTVQVMSSGPFVLKGLGGVFDCGTPPAFGQLCDVTFASGVCLAEGVACGAPCLTLGGATILRIPIDNAVPTLSEWGLILMSAALLFLGAFVLRRRARAGPVAAS